MKTKRSKLSRKQLLIKGASENRRLRQKLSSSPYSNSSDVNNLNIQANISRIIGLLPNKKNFKPISIPYSHYNKKCKLIKHSDINIRNNTTEPPDWIPNEHNNINISLSDELYYFANYVSVK
jgi:hypothetical protein